MKQHLNNVHGIIAYLSLLYFLSDVFAVFWFTGLCMSILLFVPKYYMVSGAVATVVSGWASSSTSNDTWIGGLLALVSAEPLANCCCVQDLSLPPSLYCLVP